MCQPRSVLVILMARLYHRSQAMKDAANIARCDRDSTMSDIPRDKAIELYQRFDSIHALIIRANCVAQGIGSIEELVNALNEAGALARDLDNAWAEVLTFDEMASVE